MVQGEQLKMAVFFWYLGKSDLSSEHSTEGYTGQVLYKLPLHMPTPIYQLLNCLRNQSITRIELGDVDERVDVGFVALHVLVLDQPLDLLLDHSHVHDRVINK